ncbi:polysaccharide biosynthesis C-terminal domain-containing protein [Bdellovibrio sp. HCB337]|uniref:polysaccharide biosynthesis C-terminal domain-containing protein n=1 Tax=Bdellovibrio sp. HCB337 TaxID=3394358 RepID=UPI0039A56610
MLLIALGRVAQFLILLLIMRVATTVLPPSEMGRMSLLVTTIALCALFFINPIGMFINRRLHEWNEQGRVKHYLNLYYGYLVFIFLVVSGLLSLTNHFIWFDFQTETIWLIVLIGGSLLFNTINQTAIPSLNMLGYRGWFMGLTIATLAAGFILAWTLVKNYSGRAEYWMLGLLIGQIIFAGIGIKVFLSKLRPPQAPLQKSKVNFKPILMFTWPIAISVGLNWLQMQGYRFLLNDSMGLAALGLFVAGYGVSAGLISGFESILTTYFQPLFYENVSKGTGEQTTQVWENYASAIIPSVVLLVWMLSAVAPELTRVLLGVQYRDSYIYVTWGAIAEGARVVAGVYTLAAHGRMKTQLLLLPNLVGAILSLTLVSYLVPKMGAIGAGVGLTVAGCLMVLVMHYTIAKDSSIRLPYRRLMQSLLMGGVLFLGVMSFKTLVANTGSLFYALVLLAIAGVVFLVMQYLLLRRFQLAK